MKKLGALIASLAIGIASFAPMSYAQDKGMVGISMPTKTSTRWISDGETMEKLFTEAGYIERISWRCLGCNRWIWISAIKDISTMVCRKSK